MKILGINGSPRKGKTTSFALKQALEAAKTVREDIETELIELGGLDIRDCIGCNKCREPLTCSHDDDFMRLLPTLTDPSIAGIIIGTPVYMGTMTGLCKSFLDRTVMLRRNKFTWGNVVGGVLAVGQARNGGQEITIQAVQAALLVQNMVLVGDGPPPSHYGATLVSGVEGGIENDETGITIARNLGRRLAELAIRIHS
ncbi:MAG: flavodoxin family protein [Armatimonadetes bacterium]|nr:flavodoxin family protein [Armatimonadota bacterium]